ncbi:Putative transporter MCH4 [Tolypocladium paradoxum]|uniref:Transporter MCH4 n=1 Tax=Tolypocladium paradoxum TaxID=94208 RepID=A0A2S4KSY8_9HYPO|nr:Putative transporter MCH4 [Tolypocladium paradoxum]
MAAPQHPPRAGYSGRSRRRVAPIYARRGRRPPTTGIPSQSIPRRRPRGLAAGPRGPPRRLQHVVLHHQLRHLPALLRAPLALESSVIAWIGSIQICLVFLVGTFSGRAFDAGYYRPVLVAGCLLQLVGIFTTSVARTYWQLFLAQGLRQGLGCGVVFASTVPTCQRAFAGATGGISYHAIHAEYEPIYCPE